MIARALRRLVAVVALTAGITATGAVAATAETPAISVTAHTALSVAQDWWW